MTGPIAAAGGVVWRDTNNAIEVALVHRPRYDDWTLPKGKLRPGETELTGGVREVDEELGAVVAVSRRVARVHYVSDGAPKTVTYWAMRWVDGEFTPTREVDQIRWLTPAKARAQLTYDLDRGVLRDFAALPVPDSTIVLVRHAHAGKRRAWTGTDHERPLDDLGRQQALSLAGTLRHFGPDHIVSADPLRCVQTLQPLAALVGIPVRVDPVFGDEQYVRSASATKTALLALAKPGQVSVVCSQGITIPSLVERLGPGVPHPDTRKGAAWVLSFVDGDVIAADYYEPSPP